MKLRYFGFFAVLIMLAIVSHISCVKGSLPSPSGISLAPVATATPMPVICTDPSGRTCTPTNTPTATFTPTVTNTRTVTNTPTITPTGTPSRTPTVTRTFTNTRTFTMTRTLTRTATVTSTITPTNSLTAFTTIGGFTDFGIPVGIKFYNGNLWVAESYDDNLQEWTTAGVQVRPPITSYGSPVTNFGLPWGVGIDPATGNVYVGDIDNNQIAVFDSSGTFLTAFGKTELGTGYDGHLGVAVNSTGTTVCTMKQASSGTDAINVFSIGGTPSSPVYTYQFKFSAVVDFGNPTNICLDSSNNIYVADYAGRRVVEFNSAGVSIQTFTTSVPDTFYPIDMTVDGSGNVYVAEDYYSLIIIFNSSGQVTGQFGGGISGFPNGITTDMAGNFYVTYSNTGPIIGFH
jgi:DNA-binding beta-propeller fold protein YncE